jgi:23S rRNA pseudouridine1911/1915/1917 synthase
VDVTLEADHAPLAQLLFSTDPVAELAVLLEAGSVRVDGQPARASARLRAGSRVEVEAPAAADVGLRPEPIPLRIVYRDDAILVVDKPAGLVVHPAPGHPRGTLVNAVVHHAPDIALAGTNRPGIIHRLDKDTSGLIAVAKTDRARTTLVPQWEGRTVQKTYLALAAGEIGPEEATIDVPIGRDPAQRQRMAALRTGRPAISHLRVRERLPGSTLLEVEIETGRTHQIRVHLAYIGHPVAGDIVYGGPAEVAGVPVDRQFLHAARLGFTLPDGRAVTFTAPLPADLQEVLDRLRRLAGE